MRINTPQSGIVRTLALSSMTSVAAAAHAQPPSATDVSLSAIILGITAESLACVDVQPDEIPLVFDRLEDQYSVYIQLVSAQEMASNAKQAEMRCNAILRDDSENADALQELENAQHEAILAQSLVIQLRQGLINALLEDVADASITSEIFFVSGIFQSLPAPYRLAVDSFENAKDLSWALGCQSQAEASNTNPPSEAASILGAAQSQYDVNTGLIRVQQFEAGNAAAIESWILAN